MRKQSGLRALAVGAVTAAAVFAIDPATAATAHRYAGPKHVGTCWQYNHRLDRWINSCRTRSYSYQYVVPRSEPVYPYGSYPFRYEPPAGVNGPYLGYEPYNGYESALGFFF